MRLGSGARPDSARPSPFRVGRSQPVPRGADAEDGSPGHGDPTGDSGRHEALETQDRIRAPRWSPPLVA